MKKVIYFIVSMIIIVVVLPMLIVKSCSFNVIGNGQGQIQNRKQDKDEENDDNKNDINNQISDEENKKWQDNIKIKVYIESEDKVKEIGFEEYITGVVAAEMPAEFEVEALKAQAVAARTYAYGRLNGLYKNSNDIHSNADVCTDFAHCQAWISKEDALKKWPQDKANQLWDKVRNAVLDTAGIIIIYKGNIANPVFHSTSGGKTENAEDVWDVGPVDYLKSVISEGEEGSPSFKTISNISVESFCKTLKNCYPNIKLNDKNLFGDIEILEYTGGERVKTIKIGNITLKGTEFRKVFSLKSANFELEKGENNMVKIMTYGYGHGVGMSQWGANSMAKKGSAWEEIIKHYYTGVDLDIIDDNRYIFSTK
ncbi:MAG TPA: stage II sporulation protein D [Clostridiales bacterium]|nr:stage II sporulation protein D [Clostridiales bacterium]